jgi:hypothetical protein
MPRPLRSLVLSLLVGSACLGLLVFQRPPADRTTAAHVLAAEGAAKWYRGNIHTHSLWSDGDDYLEMIGLWYKEHGYDFLTFTDHNVLAKSERWSDVLKNKGGQVAYDKLKRRFPENWVEERMVDGRLEVRLKTFDQVTEKLAVPGEFLLIQGEEISDKFKNRPIHMNATNVREVVPPLGGETAYEVIQNNTNAVIAQRERTGQPMLVHLNHPNFGYGVTAEDLMRVRGENFFEVYNGHPGVNNPGDKEHASAERIWDIINTKRLAEFDLPLLYGLATDDGHSYHKIPSRASEPGRGWVMVLARELSPSALIDAMERGEFYASSGVALERVMTDDNGMTLEIRPEPDVTYSIEFIGTRRGFDPQSTPVLGKEGQELPVTRRYSSDIGATLKTATGVKARYEFTGDELYVRAKITSSKKHPNPYAIGDVECAWVQPLRGPAK